MVHEDLDKKCEHCDYSAGTNQHLWRHIRNKHSDMENLQVEMLKCTECNEEFSRQEKLTDHFQNFHAGSSPINPEPAQRQCTEDEHNKFRCNTCEEVFTNNENLKDHMNRFHTSEFSYVCEICSYRGESVTILQKHILDHHIKKNNNGMYSCDECDAQFKTKEEVWKHFCYFREPKRRKIETNRPWERGRDVGYNWWLLKFPWTQKETNVVIIF